MLNIDIAIYNTHIAYWMFYQYCVALCYCSNKYSYVEFVLWSLRLSDCIVFNSFTHVHTEHYTWTNSQAKSLQQHCYFHSSFNRCTMICDYLDWVSMTWPWWSWPEPFGRYDVTFSWKQVAKWPLAERIKKNGFCCLNTNVILIIIPTLDE